MIVFHSLVCISKSNYFTTEMLRCNFFLPLTLSLLLAGSITECQCSPVSVKLLLWLPQPALLLSNQTISCHGNIGSWSKESGFLLLSRGIKQRKNEISALRIWSRRKYEACDSQPRLPWHTFGHPWSKFMSLWIAERVKGDPVSKQHKHISIIFAARLLYFHFTVAK